MIFMDIKELEHTIIPNNTISKTTNNSTNLNNQSFYNKLNEVIVEIDAFLLIYN